MFKEFCTLGFSDHLRSTKLDHAPRKEEKGESFGKKNRL